MSTVLRRYLITLLTKTPMMAVLVVALVAQQDRAIQDAIVRILLRRIHKPMATEHIITMDREDTITIAAALIISRRF